MPETTTTTTTTTTTATTLLADCKTWIRVTGSDFDDEITDEIEACKVDLRKRGVEVISEEDPLVRKAVKLFVKAGFGFSTDQDKYKAMYNELADSMAGSLLYKETETETGTNG